MPTKTKPQAVSKKDISGKLLLRSCIQCQLILGRPGRNSMPWNISIGSLKKSCRVDGYQDALAAVTKPDTVRGTRQDFSLPSKIIKYWMLRSDSSVHFFSKTAKYQKAWGFLRRIGLNIPICRLATVSCSRCVPMNLIYYLCYYAFWQRGLQSTMSCSIWWCKMQKKGLGRRHRQKHWSGSIASGVKRRNINGRLEKKRKLKPLLTDPPIFDPSVI